MVQVGLYVATPEQLNVVRIRHAVEWSNGVSSEEYILRENSLGIAGIGKGITCYILAPTSDPTTLDPFCSLEVYRRPILVSSKGSQDVYRDVSYSIASVFTPPQHRKQGHCRSMMNLLHSKIARPSSSGKEGSEQEVKLEQTGGLDAKMSFLYSDVGEFYKKCNWHIIEPTETKWTMLDLPPFAPLDPSLRLLTMKDLEGVSQADSAMLRVELSHSDPTKTTFAVDPSGEYEWLEARVNFYADRLTDKDGLPTPKRPKYYGVESGTRGGVDWSVLVYTIDYYNSKLKIIRTRCATPDHYKLLLNYALMTAQECELKVVIAWVVEDKWLATLDSSMKGVTYTREESLSAVSWYGSEKSGEQREQGDTVEWMANELYAWV